MRLIRKERKKERGRKQKRERERKRENENNGASPNFCDSIFRVLFLNLNPQIMQDLAVQCCCLVWRLLSSSETKSS